MDNKSDYKNKLNNHTVMIVFAVLFLVFGIICLFALWGAQTGSCETSGLGSALRSSQDDTGEISPTSEVISEFLIVLLCVIGVGMLTWALCVKGNAKKLMEKKEYAAALMINSSKDITPEDVEAAKIDQLKAESEEIPQGVLNKIWGSSKRVGRDLYDESGRIYNSGMRKSKNAYDQSKATINGTGYKNVNVRKYDDDDDNNDNNNDDEESEDN